MFQFLSKSTNTCIGSKVGGELMDPFTRSTKEAFFQPSHIEAAWAWA
jgi:hypothetical protein